MRKSSLRAIFDDFDESLEAYVDLAATIVGARRVIRHQWQKTELLQAFVVRLVALWDVFVEDLMTACLHRDSSRYAEFTGLTLRKHLLPGEAEAILTGLAYLDFRNVANARKTAKQVLVVNPFATIPSGTANKIDELLVMRNYLSHYSRRSKRSLMAMYRAKHSLQRFREPGSFLWADDRRSRRMRFLVYVQALADASSAMRHALGKLAEA